MFARVWPGTRTTAAVAMMAAWLIVSFPGLAAEQVRAPGPGEARERLVVAVVRADGILMPFATLDGDDWKMPWPVDVSSLELPANLEAVPDKWWGGAVPTNWRLWVPGKTEPQPIKLTSPIVIRVGSMRRLGVRTDLPPAMVPVPPFAVPFPKTGLAVAGGVSLKPIVSVSVNSPASREFLASVHADVIEAETRTIVALRSGALWRHPFNDGARTKIEAVMEAWYRDEAAPGVLVSYVEIVKKYPPGPKDEGCGLETFVSGWIHQSAGQARPKSRLKATVVYCDRDKASYMLPFGQVQVNNRPHWIFQMSGQDHEWFAIAQLLPDRVRFVAEFQAGGIPRQLLY